MNRLNHFGQQTRHYFNRPHSAIPQSPIEGPAAWRGRDMRGRENNWRVTLSAREIRELSTTVDKLLLKDADMATLDKSSYPLLALGESIKQWADTVNNGRGFIVVHGLPVEDWGPEKTAFAYWGIGHHLGLPGAQNPQGELLGHVKDYNEETADPMVRRYRTTGNIDFHCDAADAVGLLCMQPAKTGGQSRIVSSVAVFNEVFRRAPDLVGRLFEPFWLDRRNEERTGQPGYLPIVPCCWDNSDGLKTFYHSEYFRSAERFDDIEIDSSAKQLLDLYDEISASEEFHLDMWLQTGDMQFVSNHTTMHARTHYEDWEEPKRKRHLLRLWTSLR